MSLYNDASLVMIPSAYKDGKLYSIKPTDGSGDFTFSRGSNLAATRVDVNGLIEKGRENLLLQSNQFDTTWPINGTATLTSGQSGYDGSSDAWLLTKSASSTYISQNTTLSGINTFSVYAKAGTNTHLAFWIRNSNQGKFFDLANGTIASDFVNTPIDAKIESVGGGWYRCSITTDDATNNCRIYPADADGDVSGTSGSVYIQDAQLEAGLVATDYIETTTTTAQAGILEDMPRLDYSGGASCPSLLLEPQRSNLIKQSEYLGDNLLVNSSIDTNNTTSPEGVQNATLLTENTSSGNHALRESANTQIAADDTQYVISFYAKSNGRNIRFIDDGYSGSNTIVNFNITSGGTFSNGSSVIDSDAVAFDDGWYYCYAVIDKSAAAQSAFRFSLRLLGGASNNNDSYTGDGSSGVWIWGKQVEDSVSYPTSYIPTYGTSVTRNGEDSGTIDVSSLDVTANYTLFYEISDFNVTAISTWVTQNSSNGSALAAYGNTMILWIDGGVWYPFGHGVSGVGSNTKKAITYDGVKVRAYSDGVLVGTRDADKNRWDNLTTFDMTNGSSQMVNWNQVLIFPTALTDSECIALTS